MIQMEKTVDKGNKNQVNIYAFSWNSFNYKRVLITHHQAPLPHL